MDRKTKMKIGYFITKNKKKSSTVYKTRHTRPKFHGNFRTQATQN